MIVRPCLFVAAIVVAAIPAAAQTLPAGYRIRAEDQTLDLTLRQDEPSAFHAVVQRRVASPQEEAVLRVAESLYPEQPPVAACPDAPGDNVWYQSCTVEPRMPFALTGSAVRYYLDRVAAYRRGDFTDLHRPLSSGTMRYEASAQLHGEFQLGEQHFRNVYVVRMQLSWSVRVSPELLHAYAFRKERTVVVSLAGSVLAVHGDGRTPLRVS